MGSRSILFFRPIRYSVPIEPAPIQSVWNGPVPSRPVLIGPDRIDPIGPDQNGPVPIGFAPIGLDPIGPNLIRPVPIGFVPIAFVLLEWSLRSGSL